MGPGTAGRHRPEHALTDAAPTAVGGVRADQLLGFRVGVTSLRRADDLISALQRRGAEVLHAPALAAAPDSCDDALLAETRRVIEARPEVVLVTTGYGMRRWLEVADSAGLGESLTQVLRGAQLLARGPKSVGAIRAAGLTEAGPEENGPSLQHTTADLVDRLLASSLPARVAVQLHGYTDEQQLDRLRRAGVSVLPVTPYRWAPPGGSDRLARLTEAACAGELDAITFTSAPAVDAVLETARAAGRLPELRAAFGDQVLAAAVGPVTAGPLLEAGVFPVQPERFRLGALVRLVTEQLERRVVRLVSGDVVLELRGQTVTVSGRAVPLAPRGLSLLRTLAARETVVSRRELLSCLRDGSDDHALEVAISRLRRSLAVPGLITTVVKRGYRLNAVRVD